MSPAANALLLLVSFQDSVPGIIVSLHRLGVVSAARVSLLSIATLPSSSTSCRHATRAANCAYPLRVARRMAERKAARVAVLLQGAAERQELVEVVRDLSNPASFTQEMR